MSGTPLYRTCHNEEIHSCGKSELFEWMLYNVQCTIYTEQKLFAIWDKTNWFSSVYSLFLALSPPQFREKNFLNEYF